MFPPFSFWSPSGPPFDPAVFNATTWQRAPFAGYNWAGIASAGVSGNREVRGFSGPGVGVGGTLNGLAAIRHDATAGACGSEYFNNGGGAALDIHDVVDPGSTTGPTPYTVMGLCKILSAAAAAGAPYQNLTFINGQARWGIYFNNTKLGVWHFTGAFPFVEVNHPGVGVAFKWCVRWDGTNAQIDIGATPGTPTALAAVSTLNGVPCQIGDDTFNHGVTGSHDMWDQITMKSSLSDANRDNYFSYLHSRYGV